MNSNEMLFKESEIFFSIAKKIIKLGNNKKNSIKIASEIINDIIRKKINNKTITPNAILQYISIKKNISIDKIVSKSQKQIIVYPRQLTHFIIKELTKNKYTLKEIGQKVGDKDHATIMHSCKTINNLIETDKDIKEEVSIYLKELRKIYKLK